MMTLFEILYSIYTATYILFLGGVFLSLFTHAWVKGGYAGKNMILEIHEVTAFVAHVCTAVGIVTFIAMSLVEPLMFIHFKLGYSVETKFGVLAISGVSGAYAAFRKHIAKKLVEDQQEKDEPEK